MGKNLVNCLTNLEYIPGDRVTGVCIQNEKFLKVRVGEKVIVKIDFDPSRYTFAFSRKKRKTKIQKVDLLDRESNSRIPADREHPACKNPLNGEMVEVLITNVDGHKYHGEILAIGL